MRQALRLTERQMAGYHRIVHLYGKKIEAETRRGYEFRDKSAGLNYKLRMERDRRLQRLLSNGQFRLFIRFILEDPTRIHDWYGWFDLPNRPGCTSSQTCRRYEERCWHSRWEWEGNRRTDRFDDGKWYPGKYDNPHNAGGGHVASGRHDGPDKPGRPAGRGRHIRR